MWGGVPHGQEEGLLAFVASDAVQLGCDVVLDEHITTLDVVVQLAAGAACHCASRLVVALVVEAVAGAASVGCTTEVVDRVGEVDRP